MYEFSPSIRRCSLFSGAGSSRNETTNYKDLTISDLKSPQLLSEGADSEQVEVIIASSVE